MGQRLGIVKTWCAFNKSVFCQEVSCEACAHYVMNQEVWPVLRTDTVEVLEILSKWQN